MLNRKKSFSSNKKNQDNKLSPISKSTISSSIKKTFSNLNYKENNKVTNDNNINNNEEKEINLELLGLKKNKKIFPIKKIKFDNIIYFNEKEEPFTFKLFKDKDLGIGKFLKQELRKNKEVYKIQKEEDDYMTDNVSLDYGFKSIKNDIKEAIEELKENNFKYINNYNIYLQYNEENPLFNNSNK